jgi:putative inorganic carbon (hco3(-)) transporter
MAHDVRTRRSPVEIVALVALSLLVLVVPIVPGRIMVGRLPLDAVTVALPLALLASYPFLRRLGARRVPSLLFEVPALLFLAIALVGVVFAQDRPGAVMALARYAAYFALAGAVSAVCVRAANRRALSWAAVGGVAVTVVQATVQYLRPSHTVASFGFSDAVAARVIGSFGNPNAYAEYLVVALAIVASVVLTERRAWRWVAGAVLAGGLVAFALTYTRGSWLALLVGVLAASLIVDIRWSAAFAALGAALLAIVPGGLARLTSVFQAKGGASVRLPLWRLALHMVGLHPFTGVGLGGYLRALTAQVKATPEIVPPGIELFSAHDSYLMVAAETGIPGGLAFIWLVARIVRMCGVYAARLVRGSSEWLRHAALTAGVVAFAANAITDNTFQNPRGATVFWMLAGLMAANGAIAAATPGVEPAGRTAFLWRLPRTRGRVLVDSPLGRLVFGSGVADADAADLEPWAGVS